MITHMAKLGKISEKQKIELKCKSNLLLITLVDRVLQDDEDLIEFYKENRELHQPGVILNTSMSTLFSQS